MTRAATVASRISPRWYQVYENLLPKCGKTGAKVADGRRLLTVVYYTLKRQQPSAFFMLRDQENHSSKDR
jgi:hypothetical protein